MDKILVKSSLLSHPPNPPDGQSPLEGRQFITIIPAGFPKADTPKTHNPVRFEIGGGSALMSLVHVLVMESNGERRLYNAVTMPFGEQPDPEEFPKAKQMLLDMMKLGRAAVEKLVRGPPEEVGSLRWQLQRDGMLAMKDGTEKSLRVVDSDMSCWASKEYTLEKLRSITDENEWQQVGKELMRSVHFSAHVHKSCSIGWWHMHVWLEALQTIAFDKMEEEAGNDNTKVVKNMPIDALILALQEMEIEAEQKRPPR